MLGGRERFEQRTNGGRSGWIMQNEVWICQRIKKRM
jgi:hypothetical protein